MKLRLTIILCLLCALPLHMRGAQPATSAAEVLRLTAAILNKAPSIEASFTANNGHGSSSGSILMAGNRFHITTPEMSTWFDGKTQWAYSPSAGEVNISEPTADELQQINPFAIIESMQRNFTPRRIPAPAGCDRIELTPKGKSDYAKVVVTINSSSHLPADITVTGTDRTVVAIRISSIRKGNAVSNAKFRFNASAYPGIEIVDLR